MVEVEQDRRTPGIGGRPHAVCLVPETLMSTQGVPFQFGGTSLLIVVVVVMDFISQLQAHAMSHQYPGLMKKANLLGGRNSES